MTIHPELNPRIAALLVLERVFKHKAALEEAWEMVPEATRLEGRDREFAWLLVMVVLRHKLALERCYQAFLERALPEKDIRVGVGLMLGAAQLILLKTPPHAAVNTTVELIRYFRLNTYTGLANAVLKKIAARADVPLEPMLPEWLQDSWRLYGQEHVVAMGKQLLQEPPLDISVKSDAEGWAKRLGGVLLPGGTIRLAGGHVPKLEGFAEGAWWVQDVAAAMPAKLLGNVAGKTVFDLCAAPGGKTAQLAASGAKVIAVERSSTRIRRLKENISRLNLDVQCVKADMLEWKPPVKPDAILLDAPCSATGTFRKHPDVLWLREERDVERLAATQARMLEKAAEWLEPGGTLVYCVCSLQPEEGEQQIAKFLSAHSEFKLFSITPEEIGGLAELITAKGELRTLPSHLAGQGGMDGFYAARLKKS